jgi:hypothetical protein
VVPFDLRQMKLPRGVRSIGLNFPIPQCSVVIASSKENKFTGDAIRARLRAYFGVHPAFDLNKGEHKNY